MAPISWLMPVVFFKMSFVCCISESHKYSLNSTIMSALDILKKAADELSAVQRALPTQKEKKYPIDCATVYQNGNHESGVYRIWPKDYSCIGSFNVYCDMTTDGGGWMVIQRRGNFGKPKDYFFKPWSDYKTGFGDLTKDHWLGNDRIFTITNQGEYTLRLDLQTKENHTAFAVYDDFWIDSESYAYTMHISGYTGTAGDSLTRMNGQKFSSKDRDNDIHEKSCAQLFKGAWWYSNCHDSNLNGLYHLGNHTSHADGVNWKSWKGHNYSLKDTEMKIRSKYFTSVESLQ